ncbi:MAG: hypothetical protein QM757_33635 [Paludibaculum sp.]
MRKYFPDPRHIILSIRPVSILECEAWFFHRLNGVLPRVPSQPPEPFGQPLGKADRSGERGSRPVPAPVVDPAPPPEVQKPAPPPAPFVEPVMAAAAATTPPVPVEPPQAKTLAATAGVSSVATAIQAQRHRRRPRWKRKSRWCSLPHVLPQTIFRARMKHGVWWNGGGCCASKGRKAAPSGWTPWPRPNRCRNSAGCYDDHAAEPHKHRLWQLLAALLVLLVSGGVAYQSWDAQQRARWSRIGLDAKPGSGGLEITWDQQSPALKGSFARRTRDCGIG